MLERTASPGPGFQQICHRRGRATHSTRLKSTSAAQPGVFSTWQDQHGDDIEWHSGGYCFVAYRPLEEATLQGLLEVQKGYGLDIAWYDSRAAANAFRTSIPGADRRTYAPQDGNCSPLLAAQALYRAARRAGAEFRFDEEITAVQLRHGQHLRRADQPGQLCEPAAGQRRRGMGQWVGNCWGCSTRCTPILHEAGITEPVQRFLEPMVVDLRPTGDSTNFYFCQLKSGAVIFCITPHPNLWGTDRRETSRFLPQVGARMVDLMPILANLACAAPGAAYTR